MLIYQCFVNLPGLSEIGLKKILTRDSAKGRTKWGTGSTTSGCWQKWVQLLFPRPRAIRSAAECVAEPASKSPSAARPQLRQCTGRDRHRTARGRGDPPTVLGAACLVLASQRGLAEAGDQRRIWPQAQAVGKLILPPIFRRPYGFLSAATDGQGQASATVGARQACPP